MTNIRTSDMFPIHLPEALHYPSGEAFHYLFERRKRTYQDFANIEKDKGLLRPEMSLSSTHGQEAIRILAQRGLEELAEACDSSERDHYLEELIDAINYFWVLAIIDPNSPLAPIISIMVDSIRGHTHDWVGNSGMITVEQVGQTVLNLNPLFEKLRHRSWMVNPQSQYFDGWLEIANFLGKNLCLVLDQFRSWEEFAQFFIAKDNVLQFRIKSKY